MSIDYRRYCRVILICAQMIILTLTIGLSKKSHANPKSTDSFFVGPRWTLDSGLRLTSDAPTESYSFMGFTGVDFYSELRFFGAHRGNFVAQVYLFDFGSFELSPAFSHTLTYAPCVIAPELILAPRGLLNIKFGHIWPSYGLRNDVNTTQTLRQLINLNNVGLGAPVDWGAELNGQAVGMSYHVTLTRGSGKGWSNEGDRYILSGRLGLTESSWFTRTTRFKLGLSGMKSRLQGGAGLVERWRAGVDAQYDGPISFLFEGSMGQDAPLTASGSRGAGRDVINIIGELGWRSPTERWFVYIQQRYLSSQVPEASPAMMTSNGMSDTMSDTMSGAMSDTMSNASGMTPDMVSGPLGPQKLITQIDDSLTFGTLYEPIRSLYIGGEVALRRAKSAPLARLQIRYRW